MCSNVHVSSWFLGFVPESNVRQSIFIGPRSIAGLPFDSVRRFRATLLLRTTCMCPWGNWVASCVAALQTKNQKPNRTGDLGTGSLALWPAKLVLQCLRYCSSRMWIIIHKSQLRILFFKRSNGLIEQSINSPWAGSEYVCLPQCYTGSRLPVEINVRIRKSSRPPHGH